MSWLRRLIATLRPRRLDTELDDELGFHVEQRTQENIEAGMLPEIARREALRQFGNRTSLKESARERDIFVWLETTLQDLRYAARTLRRSPGFTATAVLSLALGIGANTALFSLLDALMLRMLPVENPQQLVSLRIQLTKGPWWVFSYPQFDLIRTHSKYLSGVTAMNSFAQKIEEGGNSVPALVEGVSAEHFEVLGVRPWRGRMFSHEDAKSAGPGVAVIGDAFWRAHYSARLSALGARLQVRERDFTVVGVADPAFRGATLDRPTDVWVPIEQALPPNAPQMHSPTWGWLAVMARMRPGATTEQVRAETEALLRQQLEEIGAAAKLDHPQQWQELMARHMVVQPAANGASGLRDRFSRPLVLIECVVGMVLLIACANLANLMLARSAARMRETAVRQALGASRGRLVRQALTESLLVAAVGAGAALLVARAISAALLRFLAPDDPALLNLSFRLDPRVLGFTAVLTVFTCLLFALGPALRATRPSVAMKEDRGWIGRALVIAEVALCTVLLLGAGLLVRTLRNLKNLDAGFVREHVLVGYMDSPRDYSGAKALERADEVRTALASVPEVRAVGLSQFLLFTGDQMTGDVEAQGHLLKPNERIKATELNISPGFFAAMGTPVLLGRDLAEHDNAGAPKVAVVNESFARQFFDGQNPIGRRFGLHGPDSSGNIEVVGMVKDAKYINLREQPAAMFYLPIRQASGQVSVIEIRARGDLGSVAAALRKTVQQVDSRLTLRKVTAFSDIVDKTLVTERMVAQLSAGFGALALLVACVGVYGMLAYRVARRTREIGVRMALGATRGGVQWMVVRESLFLLACGAVLGVPLALALTRFIATMLYGLTPADPSTLAAVLGILGLVSLGAALLPARRASRVDPMVALRCD